LLHELDSDNWDRQMAAADAGGKLYRLMEQAESEAKAGERHDFPGRLKLRQE